MNKIEKIYYINLEHRKDRREHIEKQIKEYLDPRLERTERFNGVYNENGALGCSKSHLGVIEDCIEKGYENVLILEDDFEFIIDKDKLRDYLNTFYNNYKEVDILLLGVNGPNFDNRTGFFKVKNSQTASGYIIKRRILTKLKGIYEESVKGLTNNGCLHYYAIDILWKKLQLSDNVYTFPERVGKQRADYSDICKKEVDYGV